MELSDSKVDIMKTRNEIGLVFRYTRANIYSYHALIGSLEINPLFYDIPIFIPTKENFKSEITRLLKIEEYDQLILGLSVNTFQLDENLKLIRKLNTSSYRNKIKIIVGGPHPSAEPEIILRAGADFVVRGEGEKTFPELIAAIIDDSDFSKLKGISFLDENQLIHCPKNEDIILDDYPPFAPQHELYSAIEITRGCKYRCKYCQTPNLFGRDVRYRSPENVIKWGKFLLTKRENWDFRFITPNAFGYGSLKSTEPNLKMIKELLSGLNSLEAKKRRRIFFGTFPSEVRPESVTEGTLNLTKEFCHNDNLTMGAQSGSPRILKLIRRGHTVEKVISAVDLANEFSFKMNVDFIIGYPEETEEDQYLTLDLCKELIKKNCKIHMHYLIPLPGTDYANKTPSPISSNILQTLRKWSNEGIIFGSWQYQYDTVITN